MSDIEVRSQREETRVDDSSNDEVIVLLCNVGKTIK